MSDRDGTPYGSVVADRFRHPRFRGSLVEPDASAEVFNPLCGDRLRVELHVRGGRIGAARYVGDACAICLASADILAETIEGLSAADAASIPREALIARLESPIGPSRLTCVTLPLTALRQCLDQLRMLPPIA